ncbi:hypothetical protein ACRXCV_05060 [Halobacteriovorax sp. GFR7]|uniref:hypothetical protein n=1 Tax=unclassified Halobacteriovorax TaxID=2639665 RepID=UPI003D98E5A9
MNINNSFNLKEKKDKALTVRLTESDILKIRDMSHHLKCSQSNLIEVLIENAWSQLSKEINKKSKDTQRNAEH